MKSTRTLLVLALCMLSALFGAIVSQTIPAAKAQAASPATIATVSSALQGQGSYGSGGAYTVVPIMDSGAGYSWMAYALAVSPDGKVTIINTHPKQTDELGSIVKQFSIK
jgi:hypothetical protein